MANNLIKREIRSEVLSKRTQLTKQEIKKKSQAITQNLLSLQVFLESHWIMTYLPFKGEVDTTYLIKQALSQGKQITVPKTYPHEKTMQPAQIHNLEEDLITGNYGILEPKPEKISLISPDKLDLVIVPGICFDIHGFRIGYGGGYYDKFITKLTDEAVLTAFSYEFQIIKNIPRDKWDQPIDLICTEKRVINI